MLLLIKDDNTIRNKNLEFLTSIAEHLRRLDATQTVELTYSSLGAVQGHLVSSSMATYASLRKRRTDAIDFYTCILICNLGLPSDGLSRKVKMDH